MKKILMALAITAVAYTGAEAQTKCTNEKKVCRPGADKNSVNCYETKYAQNYKVCKGDKGYYICCGSDVTANNNAEERTTYTVTHYNEYEAAFPEDNPAATVACGENEKHVCRKDANGNPTCYKTDYAQNYKVCKGANGYYICCNPPRE